ncbi:MAG: hypothetical protein WCE44_12655 [Candidatus Velthaea sp.]
MSAPRKRKAPVAATTGASVQPPKGAQESRHAGSSFIAYVALPEGFVDAETIASDLNEDCGTTSMKPSRVRAATAIVVRVEGGQIGFRLDTGSKYLIMVPRYGPDMIPHVAAVLKPLFPGWRMREVVAALDVAFAEVGGDSKPSLFSWPRDSGYGDEA